ncbi:MAG: hypothetical protein WA057_03625 [Candidatus Magasanikiibacteriota bacterium]
MKSVEGKIWHDEKYGDFLIKRELSKKKIAELRDRFNHPVNRRDLIKFDERKNPFVLSQVPFADLFLSDIKPPREGQRFVEEFEAYKKRIAEFIKGKNFFDLGCGENDLLIEDLVEVLAQYGANEYVGVDISPRREIYDKVERPDGKTMEIYVLKEEMLNFVRSIPDNYGGNVLLCGIQEDTHDGYNSDLVKKYVENIISELYRIMNTGDVIMISGPSFETIKGSLIFSKNNTVIDKDGRVLFIKEEITGGKGSADSVYYKKV